MSGVFNLPAVVPVEREYEIILPSGATSLDYLQSIYRDPRQPEHRRIRCAIAALPYEHPKQAVIATVNVNGYATQLEAARSRVAKGLLTFRNLEVLEETD